MKNLMLILVFTVSVLASYGQPPHRDGISKEKRQKLESMKVAFITQRLDLTPDEAKVFWTSSGWNLKGEKTEIGIHEGGIYNPTIGLDA